MKKMIVIRNVLGEVIARTDSYAVAAQMLASTPDQIRWGVETFGGYDGPNGYSADVEEVHWSDTFVERIESMVDSKFSMVFAILLTLLMVWFVTAAYLFLIK